MSDDPFGLPVSAGFSKLQAMMNVINAAIFNALLVPPWCTGPHRQELWARYTDHCRRDYEMRIWCSFTHDRN